MGDGLTPGNYGIASDPIGSSLYTAGGRSTPRGLEKNTGVTGQNATGSLSNPGVYDEMLRINAAVAAGAQNLFAMLQGVAFDVGAHEDATQAVVDYCREFLFERPVQPFGTTAATMLKGALIGHSAHEVTAFNADGKVWMRALEERPQGTIRYDTVKLPVNGWWAECTQQWYNADGSLQTAEYGAPGDVDSKGKPKGVLLWSRFRGGGPFGDPILRPGKPIHDRMVEASRALMIAASKGATGTAMLRIRQEGGKPVASVGKNGQISEDDLKATILALGKVRVHEHGVGYLPWWAELDTTAWAEWASKAIDNCLTIIRDHWTQMLILLSSAQLARGLLTSYGTNAASESDAEATRNLRRYFLDWLRIWMQPLLNWFVDLNFGPQRYYPELKAVYVDEMTTAEREAVLATAKGSGRYIPSRADRDAFRDELRISTTEEEDQISTEEFDAAQAQSLQTLLAAVGNRAIPVDSAQAVLESVFLMPPEQASKILAPFAAALAEKAERAEQIAQQTKQMPPPPPSQEGSLGDEQVPSAPKSLQDRESAQAAEATAAMCSCGQHAMSASTVDAASLPGGVSSGVRTAPRAGGQARRTGPGGRPLSTLEQSCDWDRYEFALDVSETTVAQSLVEARRQLARWFAEQVRGGSWQTSDDLAQELLSLTPPDVMLQRLSSEVERELGYLGEQAADTVDDEYREQMGQDPREQVEMAAAAAAAMRDGGARGFSKASAQAQVKKAVEDVRGQLVRFALSIIAPSQNEIASLFDASLKELSMREAEQSAPMVTTDVWARARADEAKNIAAITGNAVTEIRYSAVLDESTCDPCAEADRLHGPDGTPIEAGSAEEVEFMPPYQRCEGGVRCRCQLIYRWTPGGER